MRFVGLVFLALGLWCLAVGISTGLTGIKAKGWPTAKGRIVKCRVSELRSPGKIRIARLCLDLEYIYMVHGQILEGHRLNTGWRCFASEDYVRRVLERYPVGKEVTVYYNPKDPDFSVLEPGLSWSSFLLCGLGLVTLSISYPVVRQFFRSRRS